MSAVPRMRHAVSGRRRIFAWTSGAGKFADSVARVLLHARAGLLGHAELDAMTVQSWQRFGDGEDVHAGFMPWEREIYDAVTRPSDRILIVGCGRGRDFLPFVKRG